MALRLHNTLTREIEEFRPIDAGRVRVYACGPTVYRQPHIGNYRTFLFSDLLVRYLRWSGYDVRFVMNLTDVDDKTIAGAAADDVPLDRFTSPIIDRFKDDLERLGARPADAYPRATHHIADMTSLVSRLIANGHAYTGEDGSVYFDISSFQSYGRLSRLDVAGIQAGAGLATRDGAERLADEYSKEDARDFVLWKAARKADERVGAAWDTPFGRGRPGWHLECSAMSMKELGESFDIHTGGEDLIFPHHEDEIAQSEAATGQPFVRYWLHVKHLRLDDEKMSKSKGNVVSVGDLLNEGYAASTVRFALLSAHYRRELNFSRKALDDARAAVRRLADFAERLGGTGTGTGTGTGAGALGDAAGRGLAGFRAALDDDLNAPAALASLFGFVREGNAALDAGSASTADRAQALAALRSMDQVLDVIERARVEATADDPDFARWVEERIEQRLDARRRRDFAAADAVRDELTAAGVVVEDTPEGVRWRKG